MYSLVVLLSVAAVAVAAPQLVYAPLVQPPNTPAVVLDPHGRPLDTAEVASARALHYQAKALEGHLLKKRSVEHVGYSYAAPAAVSHQSRVDVHSSPALVATAPVYEARALVSPTVYAAPAAVSHQSRVDVHTSPAVVASAPVVAAAPAVIEARAAPVVYSASVYAAPSAVSHQSRVDVRTSPAVVASVPVVAAAPAVVEARAVPTYYSAPAAVSHQSRVDVHSSPAVVATAPVVEARSVYAPIVRSYAPNVYAGGYAESHQSRVDVETSPAVYTSYSAPLSYASAW